MNLGKNEFVAEIYNFCIIYSFEFQPLSRWFRQQKSSRLEPRAMLEEKTRLCSDRHGRNLTTNHDLSIVINVRDRRIPTFDLSG